MKVKTGSTHGSTFKYNKKEQQDPPQTKKVEDKGWRKGMKEKFKLKKNDAI